MKIFEISDGEDTDTIVALSKKQAVEYYLEENGLREIDIESIEEIPECAWDEEVITIYEDNNTDNEPFTVSYREEMRGTIPPAIIASTRF